MVIVLSPVRLRTLGQFTAGDPWNGDCPTQFSIEEYVMMPLGSQQASEDTMFKHRVGIRSESDGSQWMLPESLFELWRRGQVPAERIPVLAQAVSPRVICEDLELMLDRHIFKSFGYQWLLIIGIVAAVMLFATNKGEHLPIPVVLGVCTGFTGFVALIMWSMQRSARSRRAGQMKWLLAAAARPAGPGLARPEGRFIGRLKAFFAVLAPLLLVFGLLIGGLVAWIMYGEQFFGSPAAQRAAANPTGDIEKDFEIPVERSSEGGIVPIMVTETGERVMVKVPPHLAAGTRLRLRGKGAPSSTGTPGDLYLTVKAPATR